MEKRRMERRNVGKSKPYKKIQQAGGHPDRRTVPFREGEYGKFKGTLSRLCQSFVKIGVGIGHTATGGKFLRRGHETCRGSLRCGHSGHRTRSERGSPSRGACAGVNYSTLGDTTANDFDRAFAAASTNSRS